MVSFQNNFYDVIRRDLHDLSVLLTVVHKPERERAGGGEDSCWLDPIKFPPADESAS